MRIILFISIVICGSLLTSCGPRQTTAPLVFQLRSVENEASADTEPMTEVIPGPTSNITQTLNVQKKVLMDQTAFASASVSTHPETGIPQVQGSTNGTVWRGSMKPQTGTPQVDVVLTDKGREKFAEITRQNIDRRIAFVMDGKILTAPMIREEITAGRFPVLGHFSPSGAQALVNRINETAAK